MNSADGRDSTLRGLLAELDRLRASEERLKTELEELRESQQVLEATLEHYVDLHELSPVACVTLDSDGRVIGANRRALSLLCADRSQLNEIRLHHIVVFQDRRRFVENLVASKRSGQSTTFEVTLLRAGFGRIPVRLSVRATKEEGSAYAVALVDLREREAALAERDQLAREERAARQENESKNLRIAMLSRGLRAPLTPVLAAAGKLAEQGGLSRELGVSLSELETAISALHYGIRRVGMTSVRRGRDQASPKIQLRAQARGHRRRYRAAR